MDFPLPELGEGVYEAEFVSWLVNVGDTVKRGQSLMEVLTDKATMEVPAAFSGKITALNAEPGQKIKVGEVILSYEPAGSEQAAATQPTQPMREKTREIQPDAAPRQSQAPAFQQGNGNAQTASRVKAAPSVRLLARKLGIDIGRIRGTGPEGRILIEDLSKQIGTTAGEPAAGPMRLEFDLGKPGTKVKLIGLRRRIAEHLVHSKHTAPHYSYIDECDVSELVRLRDALRKTAAQRQVKLTYLAFIVKAVVAALKEVPIVNASLDDEAEEIVLHDRYNIGIAVAAPQGLIVPVIHNADGKDVFQIAKEIEQLSQQARSGKVQREDLQGGTFTVTSIGGVGGLISTPIIHHPEVAILGIGKVVKRPVYDDHGNIRPADLLYLSFSFDHRVVDGAVGAVFGNAVKEQLENPAALLVANL